MEPSSKLAPLVNPADRRSEKRYVNLRETSAVFSVVES